MEWRFSFFVLFFKFTPTRWPIFILYISFRITLIYRDFRRRNVKKMYVPTVFRGKNAHLSLGGKSFWTSFVKGEKKKSEKVSHNGPPCTFHCWGFDDIAGSRRPFTTFIRYEKLSQSINRRF